MDSGFHIRLTVKDQPEEGLELEVGIETASGGAYARRTFTSYQELEKEVEAIKGRLRAVLEEAREALAQRPLAEVPPAPSFQPSEDPAENWRQLEAMESDDEFFRAFNGLDEEQRKSVADYVLTSQNIFKGRASLFSLHYDEETCSLK